MDSEGYNESTKRFIRPDRIGFQNSISSGCARGQGKRSRDGTGRGAITQDLQRINDLQPKRVGMGPGTDVRVHRYVHVYV